MPLGMLVGQRSKAHCPWSLVRDQCCGGSCGAGICLFVPPGRGWGTGVGPQMPWSGKGQFKHHTQAPQAVATWPGL